MITLDGDPSAVASTGTCNIFQTVVCGVKHGVTAAYERYRLRIPAETTAEGYHLLGVFMAGPVAFFGQDPDWGWVEGIEPNTEIVEDRAGRRSAHKRGPARRRVEINWPSGWDSTGIYGSSPDPSYVVARDAAGFPGVGVQGDSAVLEGLVRRCEGGRYPVVYFPRLDAATVASSEFTYTGH